MMTIPHMRTKVMPELTAYKDHLARYFVIDDWQAIDIIMAVAVAHKEPGEMLWLRVIGASGSGKTEILRALIDQAGYSETMETLTPSSIRRGFKMMKTDKKTGDVTPIHQLTLLKRIDGKLVITKEIAPMLTANNDAKVEVFGLLRSVHDGEIDSDYGSMEGHIKQKCHFDWILGATSFVDRQNQLEGQLGTRFIDLRWGTPLSVEMAIKQATRNDSGLADIRAESNRLVGGILTESRREDFYPVDAWLDGWLAELSSVVATLRTPILRDGYKKYITDIPVPEVGTRVGQGFSRVAKGLSMLGLGNSVRPHITRLGWDSIVPIRARYIEAKLMGLTTQAQIANYIKVSQQQIGFQEEELTLLGVFEPESWKKVRNTLGKYPTSRDSIQSVLPMESLKPGGRYVSIRPSEFSEEGGEN